MEENKGSVPPKKTSYWKKILIWAVVFVFIAAAADEYSGKNNSDGSSPDVPFSGGNAIEEKDDSGNRDIDPMFPKISVSGDETYTNSAVIRAVQAALNAEAYDCGTVDGIAGKKTKEAILAYKADHGLDNTSDINAELLASLNIQIK